MEDKKLTNKETGLAIVKWKHNPRQISQKDEDAMKGRHLNLLDGLDVIMTLSFPK